MTRESFTTTQEPILTLKLTWPAEFDSKWGHYRFDCGGCDAHQLFSEIYLKAIPDALYRYGWRVAEIFCYEDFKRRRLFLCPKCCNNRMISDRVKLLEWCEVMDSIR